MSTTPPQVAGAYPNTPARPRTIPPPIGEGPAPCDEETRPAPREEDPGYPILPTMAAETKTKETLSAIPKVEPKLEGQANYASWMMKMENTLFLFDVSYTLEDEEHTFWDIVIENAICPADEKKKNKREWLKADKFALLTMQKNCESEPLAKIEMCTTAKDAYEALKSQYEGKTATDIGTIIHDVFRMTYDDRTTTINDHITDYDKRWAYMRSTVTAMVAAKPENEFYKCTKGYSENDEAKTEFLLLTLPPFYSQLVENLRTKTDYTYGDVVRNLKRYVPARQHQGRRSTTIGRETQEYKTGTGSGAKLDPVILAMRGPTDRFGRPLDTSKQCGYCQKVKKWRGIGHTENECKTKQKERGSGNQQPRTGRIEPFVEDEFDIVSNAGGVAINMIKRIALSKEGQYEYDTGAQVHTTNELWRLTERKPGITITAANGTKTTAQCSGTLKMKHQGRDIILKGVLYHPSFYNLISGQKLGDHTISSVGRTMEVRLADKDKSLLYKIERDENGTMWVQPDDIQRVTILKVNQTTL